MHTITITTIQTTIPASHEDLWGPKKAVGTWLKKKGFTQHGYVHNHETDEDPSYIRQKYPLIQLRCPKGRFMLWGMNEGAEILQKIMLQEMLRGFQWKGHQCYIMPKGTSTEKKEIGFLPGKELKWYSLNYFIALNPENAEHWQKQLSAARKMERIRELIINNMAMFFTAAGSTLDKKKTKTEIYWIWKSSWETLKIKDIRTAKIEEYKVIACTLDYFSNLLLPDGIAIGRQTKLGFGWQTERKKKSNIDLLTPFE